MEFEREEKYFRNKRADRTYFSRAIKRSFGDMELPPIRFASKVFDPEETHLFAKIKEEVVVRITPSERQEVVAKFYEDSRQISTLIIQKFTKKMGIRINIASHFKDRKLKNYLVSLSTSSMFILMETLKRRWMMGY